MPFAVHPRWKRSSAFIKVGQAPGSIDKKTFFDDTTGWAASYACTTVLALVKSAGALPLIVFTRHICVKSHQSVMASCFGDIGNIVSTIACKTCSGSQKLLR